jgi:hypothetical protein
MCIPFKGFRSKSHLFYVALSCPMINRNCLPFVNTCVHLPFANTCVHLRVANRFNLLCCVCLRSVSYAQCSSYLLIFHSWKSSTWTYIYYFIAKGDVNDQELTIKWWPWNLCNTRIRSFLLRHIFKWMYMYL